MEMESSSPDRRRLERCCMVCIKIGVDHYDLLQTPSWVVIVHLVAIELLNMLIPLNPVDRHEPWSLPSSPMTPFSRGRVGGVSRRIAHRQLEREQMMFNSVHNLASTSTDGYATLPQEVNYDHVEQQQPSASRQSTFRNANQQQNQQPFQQNNQYQLQQQNQQDYQQNQQLPYQQQHNPQQQQYAGWKSNPPPTYNEHMHKSMLDLRQVIVDYIHMTQYQIFR